MKPIPFFVTVAVSFASGAALVLAPSQFAAVGCGETYEVIRSEKWTSPDGKFEFIVRVSGWSDKNRSLELYPSGTVFDDCGEPSHEPVWGDSLDEDAVPGLATVSISPPVIIASPSDATDSSQPQHVHGILLRWVESSQDR